MTPRAQELFNLAKDAEQVKQGRAPTYREVAKRLASALAAMEQDLSAGFVRDSLVPGSITAFREGRLPDASE